MIPSVLVRRAREMVLDYLRTTFNPSDDAFEERLVGFLDGPDGLFRGPYIDLRLPFRRAPEETWVPLEYRPSFRPYAHQVEAFHRLSTMGDRTPRSTLVATGTGSGKTECFLFPILDHCLRHAETRGVKAILLYPMNALANDQARRLARLLWDDPRLRGTVSAGLYVGGKGEHGSAGRDHLIDVRGVLRSSPPDILLTNYRMLDFLLMRPEDGPLWRHNRPDTLRYLVLDELHTYDGAQGTDVACLTRRLKARLGMERGSLCCVGTSATLGARSRDEAARALVRFAETIFGEPFETGGVITEERLSVRETLGDRVDLDRYPAPDRLADLDPDRAGGPEEWLRVQAALWLGEESAGAGPAEIAEGLERHVFLRLLLQALDGRLHTLDELCAGLARLDSRFAAYPAGRQPLCIESFLGLIAHARRPAPTPEEPERVEPFLAMQVHLWMRELRRLLVRVGPASCGYFGHGETDQPRDADHDRDLPAFAWHDQLPRAGADGGGGPCAASSAADQRGCHWLPLAWCRDCGAFGLASFLREGRLELQTDAGEIGRAWLDRREECRFLSFGEVEPGETKDYVCPACLRLTHASRCSCGTGEPKVGLAVRVSRAASDPNAGRRPRFLRRCPDCGTSMALSLLGSRAPSLLSVVLSGFFSSAFNADRKMLAFTDSVQDASHRASFFGGRTYRFTLRRAIQVLLESTDEDVPLAEAADRVIDYWRHEAPEADRLHPARLVATLLPPDLQHLSSYRRFVAESGAQPPRDLLRDLRQRLSWEIVMEYGLTTRVGRTLENTLCSTARFDREALGRVAENLALDIAEEGMLETLPAGRVEPAQVLCWLHGLLWRWRRGGGVLHELVDRYFRSGGRWFLLTKRAVPLLSPFNRESVLPIFVTDALPAGEGTGRWLDSVASPANRRTWYRDWAARSLGIQPADGGLNELHRRALRRLRDAGLLEAHHLSGASGIYGIRPEALRLTRRLEELECPECRRRIVLPSDELELGLDGPCRAFRCRGRLCRAPREPNTYYADLYRSGRLERIFPREHTGLLEKRPRQEMERRFKRGDAPDGPNMIVCTPTLEMGIDVGDLSGVMLCSVPPSTSNFLQRIGRAGRMTGNAALFTMVVARPHDLFFYAEPREMMSGTVYPPGCFLDAPEMLRRQLVAHAMDQWARRSDGISRLPRDAGSVLSESGWAVFPGRFVQFYRAHRREITASFLTLFGSTLSPRNRARLEEQAAGESVPDQVAGAFESLRRERNELRNLLQRARRRRREIELQPESVEQPEAERAELDEAIRVIRRLIDELGRKYPLNVLTDAGVIPNYAFPEPGVTLDSVIREEQPGGPPKNRVYAFQRPASTAIREFAPFNTFYADGRKVRVDEIDLGPRDMPLVEDWRCCEACNHMGRVAEETRIEATCPSCGHPGWSDAGQVRSFVLFRKARSLTPLHEASSVSDADDRDEEHYELLDLVETINENRSGAWAIPSLPFGYELLRDQVLRQVNFGRAAGGGPPFRLAGHEMQARGFEVCTRCGRVREDGEIRHSPQCPARRSGQTERTRTVFLYREVRSEALRVLLPVSEVGVDVALASFQAALQLGFRRHFQGSPGHLALTQQHEPAEGGGHRNFLLVFDAVPGGTGYLAELVEGGAFFQVLEGALRALTVCSCRQDPTKDGCYRCLYGYHGAHRRELVSSRCAEHLLTRILERRAEITPVGTLSDVSIAERTESELETKFLRALESRILATPGATWERMVTRGEYSYRIRFTEDHGGISWMIRPQVNLGSTQGVYPSSRPDFLIVPGAQGSDEAAESGAGDESLSAPRAIAVFCDGLAYHVKPGQPSGGIADDLPKRAAILRTGRHRVWSVTWKDVEDFERDAGPPPWALFASLDPSGVTRILERTHSERPAAPGGVPRDIARRGSMEMLLAYLRAPEELDWTGVVEASVAVWLAVGPHVDPGTLASLEDRLESAPQRFELDPEPAARPAAATPGGQASVARVHVAPWSLGLLRCSSADLRQGAFERARAWLRLFDEPEGRADTVFEESWRAFLQAWNVLQFHASLVVASSESLPELYESDLDLPLAADRRDVETAGAASERPGTSGPRPASPGPAAATQPSDLADLLAISTASARPLIRAAVAAGFELPVFDHELAAPSGRTEPQAELAWPRLRVAVLSARQGEDRSAFERVGWSVCVQPVEPEVVVAALRQAAAPRMVEG